jgi:hypothetical protein
MQTPAVAPVQPHSWKDFHERFMQLAHEEQGRTDVITNGKTVQMVDKVLRAYYNYKEHPEGWEKGKPEQGRMRLLKTPPHGVWDYGDGISENFLERVRLCVAEAGRALPDYPKGADSEDFWLHRLYFDLLKNNSDLLFCDSSEVGMVLSLCVASATFCSRLERLALHDTSRAQNSAKTAPNVESISVEHDLTGGADSTTQSEAPTQTPTSQAPGSPAAMSDVEKAAEPAAKRGPDMETHKKRVDFEDGLRSELAAIHEHLGASTTTLDELRVRFQNFKLWALLPSIEQQELVEKEFKPRAYARALTARQFGVSPDAIKKSRHKWNHRSR